MMIELAIWACAAVAMVISGAGALAFGGMAREQTDVQEQEFCIAASATCTFLFFITLMVLIVFIM